MKRIFYVLILLICYNSYANTQGIHLQTQTIDPEVQIGHGTYIATNVHISGSSMIGKNCIIGTGSVITDSTIEDNTIIQPYSIITKSTIGEHAQIGPFAHVQESEIEKDAIIGNFVEVKRSHIGEQTKAKHLSYLGDTTTGEKVNVGAGTITCNYDGVKKHKTTIGNNAFIGSHTTLVAPVCVGNESMTAAGSVITQNVPDDSLAIARARQTNKLDYVRKLIEKFIQRCA